MALVNGVTLDVCVDCYLCLVNDECGSDSCQHMSKAGDGPLTPGCLDCERCECCESTVCDCVNGDRGHGFSWRTCDGCGSTLGGDRYPVVVWEEE